MNTVADEPASGPPRWLEGVVVLDLTRYVAGPVCTRLLVEMGADVIKVEHPPYGDPNRSSRPRINRRSGAHIQQNRGKRSLCIDINTDAGAALIRDLAAHVDVVVENFSPGVMDRKGLGYGALSAINPDLVMASISGFGQTGTLAAQPCFDLVAQGYAGIMHMTGDPDGPPTFAGIAVADNNAGVHAFAAIGHALFHRERTGEGTHLDIAMVDSLFHFQEEAIHAASMDPEFVAMRSGREHPSIAPAGTFRAPDGWVTILCTEAQVRNLWAAMGQPELVDDPRFDTNPHRTAHRREIRVLIERWMATFDTYDEVLAALAASRVPSGPVLAPGDALTHPHFVERGLVRTVEDPLAGSVALPAFPFRSTSPLPPDDYETAALGEHNAEVLVEILGLSQERVAQLAADGVLASKGH
jgi:crotonobetainyl-CoA:carnitine CoA-transferase CaiB-like acyl-CoA transferase